MGLEVKTSRPAKRPKMMNHHHTTTFLNQSFSSSEQDKIVYERNKTAMKKMKASERSSKTAQFLMKETLPLRQKWIQDDLPIVKEIISEFPLLENYINVSMNVYVVIATVFIFICQSAAHF